MRNLKRALSLLLSSTMVLGMLVMGGSAAGYKDVDRADNQEAIEVLQAVGIMTGDENGNFNPDKTVTRNEMAVIMSQLLNLDYDYYRGTNPFTDVPDWAAPYVAACAAEGVVAGIGNGQFGGNQKVTAAQASLMIMKALGYFQNAEDFGSDWQVATIRQASYIDLFDGINANAETALTRNQIAQLVLNGLKSDMVYFTGDKGIQIGDVTVGYKGEYTVRTSSDKKYNTLVGGTTDIVASDKYTIQLGEELYNGKLTERSATDAFERPATTWRYDNSDIGTYADAPDASYTAGVKLGTIYNDLGLSKGIDETAVTLYVDGASATWAVGQDIVKGSRYEIGGNGSLTEVYYNDEDNTATIIISNTYVAEINAARAATTTKDAYVTLDVSGTYTRPTGATLGEYETDEFAKGDVVYYTYSFKSGENCIQSMELAEKVTGAMTTYTTTGSVTVAGTKYDANAQSAANIAGFVTSVDKGSDVTVYLDAYGYALYVDADVEVNYAVVLNYTANAGDFNRTPKAELLFTDGTVKTVEVQKGIATGTTGFINDGGTPADPTDDSIVYETGLTKYDVVSYTVDSDDVYTINVVADAQSGKAGDAFVMENGSNIFSIVSGNVANVNGAKSTRYADGKTIFLVADTSGSKTTYSVYEGIANMPTIKHNGGAASSVAVFMNSTSNNDPATVVFIEKNNRMSMASDNKDVIYVKGNNVGTSYTTELGSYYEYDAFINGEETTIKVDTTMRMTQAALIYGPVYNNKGILIGYEDAVWNGNATDGTLTYTTTTDSVVNDVVKLGGVPYAYTSDVNVYFITVDGELVKSEITAIAEDNNDEVFFKVNDKGRLTDVYVKVNDTATSVTPGTGKLASVALQNDGSGNIQANVTLTGAVSTLTNTKVTVQRYMEATDKWVDVAVDVTVGIGASYNTSGWVTVLADAQVVATSTYRVVVTLDGATMTSGVLTSI